MAQVRQNRTAGQLLPYGFEVRTQHQLGSVLHQLASLFSPIIYRNSFLTNISFNQKNQILNRHCQYCYLTENTPTDFASILLKRVLQFPSYSSQQASPC